jgi:hypothetical protein
MLPHKKEGQFVGESFKLARRAKFSKQHISCDVLRPWSFGASVFKTLYLTLGQVTKLRNSKLQNTMYFFSLKCDLIIIIIIIIGQFAVRFINLLLLFRIRKNCLKSGKSQL